MKLMILNDSTYGYLVSVLEDFVRGGGVSLEALEDMTALHRVVAKAQDIDFSKLGPMTLDKIGPGGVSLGFDIETKPTQTEILPLLNDPVPMDPARKFDLVSDPHIPQSPGC